MRDFIIIYQGIETSMRYEIRNRTAAENHANINKNKAAEIGHVEFQCWVNSPNN